MALIITSELLDKYKACEAGKKFMDRFYPDGADCIELAKDKHVPIDFLHWGAKMLPIGAEELKAYEERIEVQGCRSYHECQRCKNSHDIIRCTDVENSGMIFTSDNVKNSNYVISSSHVSGVVNVYNSNQLSNCSEIYAGMSLVNCRNIYSSAYSKNCQGLMGCEFCFNSQNLVECRQMESCAFCSNCSDLTNSIFCYGIEKGENLIFNKPVNPAIIEMAKTEFEQMGGRLLQLSDEWRPPYLNLAPRINIDPREVFGSFPTEYWTFAARLPNYDPQILYSITYLDYLLK